MKVAGENYRGIEYVRISSLPDEQKLKINSTFSKYRVIKILKGKELLSDCIQYADYQEWYAKTYAVADKTTPKPRAKGAIYIPNFKAKKVLR